MSLRGGGTQVNRPVFPSMQRASSPAVLGIRIRPPSPPGELTTPMRQPGGAEQNPPSSVISTTDDANAGQRNLTQTDDPGVYLRLYPPSQIVTGRGTRPTPPFVGF